MLKDLLQAGLVRQEDWQTLPAWGRQRLASVTDVNRLLDQLLNLQLLTGYQAGRIRARKPQWLMLGNYRVLDRLGAGSLGVVFKAEHLATRELVAVKILVPLAQRTGSRLLQLLAERRSVAQVQHPNIVRVLDVGEAASQDPECPVIYYYVTEYVTGVDLEHRVNHHGPLHVEEACEVAHQVASALAAAHAHGLVHRDLKPSNIVLALSGQARLLDFGLLRSFHAALGDGPRPPSRPEFLAPEQADPNAAVNIRTDLYSLGTTLYWSLTGKPPFPVAGAWDKALAARAGQTPPPLSDWGVVVPEALQALLKRLLAFRPEDRPAQPEEVVEALRLLLPNHAGHLPGPPPQASPEPAAAAPPGQVLVVDADPAVAEACRAALAEEGLAVDAAGGKDGADLALAGQHDVLLLAAELPDLNALDLLRYLRKHPPCAGLKILALCATAAPEPISQVLSAGADDYLTKPLDPTQLRMRVKTALHLRQSQMKVPAVPAEPVAVSAGADPSHRGNRRWWRPLARLFGA
jgi:CheY-like chemotaxis protein